MHIDLGHQLALAPLQVVKALELLAELRLALVCFLQLLHALPLRFLRRLSARRERESAQGEWWEVRGEEVSVGGAEDSPPSPP